MLVHEGLSNIPETLTADEIKASRLRFITAVGSYVSWIPFLVISILENGLQMSSPTTTAQWVSLELAFFSRWINPLIYGIMSHYAEGVSKYITL